MTHIHNNCYILHLNTLNIPDLIEFSNCNKTYRNLLFFSFTILNFCMQNFLHENFYKGSNYSNKAVIYINHTKIFLHKKFYHEIFLHENKANYGMFSTFTFGCGM